MKGLGDGNDTLVTIGANPKSPAYGKVIHQIPLGGEDLTRYAGPPRLLWTSLRAIFRPSSGS